MMVSRVKVNIYCYYIIWAVNWNSHREVVAGLRQYLVVYEFPYLSLVNWTTWWTHCFRNKRWYTHNETASVLRFFYHVWSFDFQISESENRDFNLITDRLITVKFQGREFDVNLKVDSSEIDIRIKLYVTKNNKCLS